MADYPAAHCHPVTSVVHGNEALVLVYVGHTGQRWFDGIRCRREADGWREEQTYTCEGGFTIGEDDEFGFMVSWGEVAAEVEAVRLAFQGETIEMAVTEQVYLFTCWRAPASAQFPHVAQYRVAGQ